MLFSLLEGAIDDSGMLLSKRCNLLNKVETLLRLLQYHSHSVWLKSLVGKASKMQPYVPVLLPPHSTCPLEVPEPAAGGFLPNVT
ncbi:hypothetical protein ATANTOWER_023664 [Ataeniobius toweri]|uniref:Uncharacterized protein n=1 Tax=Ataeniobius toweri TaxID=208326 RepID=A0ABU7BHA7_9TELE|nr:hypothetical protein [Ataeniobius toweri]